MCDVGCSARRQRGMILIAVMIIVMMAAMVAASLMYRMRAEVASSAATDRGEQAYQAAMSGLQTALTVLRSNPDPSIAYDNPALFQNQLVYDDGADKWYFTIYADPDPSLQGSSGISTASSSGSGVRYGLSDEAGKVNLNVADTATLSNLPGLSADLAAALISYRGIGVGTTLSPLLSLSTAASQPSSTTTLAGLATSGGVTSTSGVGQEYYDQLPQPYFMPNGPLSSVDELLLVKGFTPQVVYGMGVSSAAGADNAGLGGADASGASGSAAGGGDSGTAMAPSSVSGSDDSSSFALGSSQTLSSDSVQNVIDPGLKGLTTVYSYDLNVNSQHQPRISLNSASAAQITALGLPAQAGLLVQQYRADGHTFVDPSQLLNMTYTPATTQPASGIQTTNTTSGATAQAGQPMSSGVNARKPGHRDGFAHHARPRRLDPRPDQHQHRARRGSGRHPRA